MAAVDTNVLVRLVTRDDPSRYQKALLEMAELNIQQHGILEAALETWAGSNADFADCFILETVKAAAAVPLGTFDPTLAKLKGCHRIK